MDHRLSARGEMPRLLDDPVEAYPGLKARQTALSTLSKLFWLALWVLGGGVVLLILPLLYVLALAAHYYCMARLHAHASQILPGQSSELTARFQACCQAVRMTRRVDCHVLADESSMGRLTLLFLRRYQVVLRADMLAALRDDVRALNFYLGHELGHIGQDATARQWWVQVALLLPLLGASYMRARHYTADRFGMACCRDADSAARALVVMSGAGYTASPDLEHYAAQARGGGLIASLREVCVDTPRLCKRVLMLRPDGHVPFPRRHPLAVLLAALAPRTPFGTPGALALYCALAALILFAGQPAPHHAQAPDAAPIARTPAERAPPAVQGDDKLALSQAYASGMAAADDIDLFIARHHHAPLTVREAGFIVSQEHVQSIVLTPDSGVLTVTMRYPLAGIAMTLTPNRQDKGDKGSSRWICSLPPGVNKRHAPPECRADAAP